MWVWSPLLAIVLLTCESGCGRGTQPALKAAPKVATLLVRNGKVAIFEIGAVELDALILKYAPQELEALLPRFAVAVGETPVTGLGSMNLGRYSRVNVWGSVDDLAFASKLNQSGVPHFQSLNDFNLLLNQHRPMDLAFLGSKDATTFRSMYGNQDISAIVRATEGKEKIGSIVESLSGLKTKLLAEPERNVTLVFHNENGMIPFSDGNLPLATLGKEVDLSRLTLVSCHTSGTVGLGLRSTGTVSLDSAISALRTTQQHYPGTVTALDYWSSFTTSYNEIDRSRNLVIGLKVGGWTTGAATGLYIGGQKLANQLQGVPEPPRTYQWPSELTTGPK